MGVAQGHQAKHLMCAGCTGRHRQVHRRWIWEHFSDPGSGCRNFSFYQPKKEGTVRDLHSLQGNVHRFGSHLQVPILGRAPGGVELDEQGEKVAGLE